MVEIVVTAQPDRERLVRGMRHARRTPVRRVRLLCAGYVAAGVGLLFPPSPYVKLVGCGFLIAAVFTQLAQWATYRVALRQNLLGSAMPRTVTLTDRGVELATRHRATRLDWQVVKGVDLMPGLMIIHITDRQFWAVPTDGLTGEEIEEITAALTRVPWGRETMAA